MNSVSSTGVRSTLGHSSDRWKKPQTEAKTCWSAQLSLTARGGGGALNCRQAHQHMQHRVDMQLRRSAQAAVRLALKTEGWEASAGTRGDGTDDRSAESLCLGPISGLLGRGAEIQQQDASSWCKTRNEGMRQCN